MAALPKAGLVAAGGRAYLPFSETKAVTASLGRDEMKTEQMQKFEALDIAAIEREAQRLRARAVAAAFGGLVRSLRNAIAALPRALRAPRAA